MTVFAVYNLKGGVGKTAAAVNLAWLSADTGNRTLVWDLDPQGAASFYFRIKPKIKGSAKRLVKGKVDLDAQIRGSDFERLDLLPADLTYRKLDIALDRAGKPNKRLASLLKPFGREYDHVFLDCPPSLTQVSMSVFRAADVLLVPVIPTTLSLRTLGQINGFLRKRKIDKMAVLPFFSMVDRRKRLHRTICDEREAYGSFLDTVIPFSSAVERMGISRAPLVSYDRSGVATKAFHALWAEILADRRVTTAQ